ncbi:MAG: NTP transferase domain-containing protein, partial [Bacteroidetes bacterium]|nr:NTP transferase domain-containing protein [Bacteroidota bacterium]
MEQQQLALIVPAAGSGERLGEKVPKPYIEILDKSILEYTLSAFRDVSGLGEVIVATSKEYEEQTAGLLKKLFPGLRTVV